MKFQKHLQWHLVPEWEEFYCNYKLLKHELRKIRQLQQEQQNREPKASSNGSHGLLFLPDVFSLAEDPFFKREKFMVVHPQDNGDTRRVLCYKTELFTGTDQERCFFQTLDSQLNFINEFYAAKEAEFGVQARVLDAKLSVLLLRIASQKLEDADSTGSTNVQKDELYRSKKFLSNAFAELYRGLVLLRNYSLLNRMAFRKIVKKFDKITGRSASAVYMRAVGFSYFCRSAKVLVLMDQVEDIFLEHFVKGNRQAALAYLKPLQQESRGINFSLGLFTGCCFGLLVALFAVFLLSHKVTQTHILKTFPMFSTLALIVLHLCTYTFNLYFWQRARIDYASIFQLVPGTELKHQDMMLVVVVLTTLLVAGMVAYLLFDNMNLPFSSHYIPFFTIFAFLVLLFSPLKLLYKPARYKLLQTNFRIICSPFFKVMLTDFFVADQLTSQGTALKGFGFSFCYYGASYLGQNTGTCQNTTYQYFLVFLPYWWRFLQCVRKWCDEEDRLQLANSVKYLCGIMAIASKWTYSSSESTIWTTVFILTSTCATVYQLYWDVVVDWGLLRSKSRNAWLRDHLALKNKSAYRVSMVLNVFLRFAWLHFMLPLKVGATDHMIIEFVFACMEVLRRGLWNFYRLENEACSKLAKVATSRIKLEEDCRA